MTDDKEARAREQARLRRAKYREGKVNVSFTTKPEIRDALYQIAQDHRYSTIKEFFEALALGYIEIKKDR